MYEHILVPIALDHGNHTAQALELAQKLKKEGGRITALTVIEEVPPYIAQYIPEGQLEKNLEEARAQLKAEIGGIPGVKAEVILGHPGISITEYAENKGVDLIVIASHRPGLQDYFLGSTAARVVRHANCSVHVVR